MAIIGDVFGLTSIYERQVENIANDNFESWPESATYGYFGGGRSSSPYVDTIDRLDFSNETISLPGNNLSQARSRLAAVSSSSYGYFGGGLDSPPTTYHCTIDRLDFSNETISVSGTGLPYYRVMQGGTSSNSYGYFGGGYNGSIYLATIDRIDFSNETISIPGSFSVARENLAAVSSTSYGYFGGGYVSPSIYHCTIDRLDFSNETTSTPFGAGNGLSQAKNNLAATESNSYGYFGGGYSFPPNTYYCTIDRLDFSNETMSAPGKDLSQGRSGLSAVSNSSYGYFGGGYSQPATPDYISTIDRIDFSNETTSAPGNNLTEARNGLAGVSGGASYRLSGSKTYGYFAGGGAENGSPPPSYNLNTTYARLNFSSETFAAVIYGIGYTFNQYRRYLAAVSSSSYGYFGGGEGGPTVSTWSNQERLDFSNETFSRPDNYLPSGKYGLAGCSSSSYGYFGGGSPLTMKIQRLDFSNETFSSPGNGLSQARTNLAATESNSYAYFAGGDTNETTVDRLDFSNDTTTVNNPMPYGRGGVAALSSNSYGYFGGGTSGTSAPNYTNITRRLDFSNHTFSAPNNLLLSQARADLAGTSSNSYGYFAGGDNHFPSPSPISLCTIDRLDFSSETISVPGTGLPQPRQDHAAVSN
jgi:hypothetical protein